MTQKKLISLTGIRLPPFFSTETCRWEETAEAFNHSFRPLPVSRAIAQNHKSLSRSSNGSWQVKFFISVTHRVLSKYRRFVLISFWGDTANAHHQLCWCFGDPQRFDRGWRRETLISMTSKLISVTHFHDKIRSRRLYFYRMGPKKSGKQRQKAYEEPSEVGRVQGEGQCYSDSVMEMSHGNELMMSWKRVYPVATPNRIAMGNQKATRLILRTGGVTPI